MKDEGDPKMSKATSASEAVSTRKVTSLRDLPREIEPARDLWPELRARLGARESGHRRPWALSGLWASSASLRWGAAVATILVATTIGVFIGRGLLPVNPARTSIAASGAAGTIPAYLTDPSYQRQREALLRSLKARLATLPPQSRQKVLASLATIHRSMQEIQAALGREPGDALLQELLVDTYQDEMRVLTTVQEASARGEI